MSDWMFDHFGGLFALFIAVIMAGFLVYSYIYYTGRYHYEYRCTGPVVEQRLTVLDIPIAGWEPTTTFPNGACS